MAESWLTAAATIGVAVLVVLLPGAVVMVAGWGARRSVPLLFAPAVSVALIGASAVLAPAVGLSWSPLPLAALTAIAALVALGLRRWRPADARPDPQSSLAFTVIVVAIAAAITLTQFTVAFGTPDNIAQRFDNIVHLNTVRYALETANASPFHIGASSDIPFYPSSWHAIVTLTATLTGASIPLAVTAANLAMVSVLWVFSSVALGACLFPGRRLAVVASAAFSTGFGAFPALFFNFGVLYPNALGYSMIPAGLAAVVILLRSQDRGAIARNATLVATLTAGTFLAHPNAFVSLFVFVSAYVLGVLAVRLGTARTRRATFVFCAAVIACSVSGIGLWQVADTNASVWGWAPWQGPLGAIYDGVTATPRGYGSTVILLLAMAFGIGAVLIRPRLLPVALPFATAVALFVLTAGVSVDNPARVLLTDPWYSDPNRLAALLPVAAIPVATLGVIQAFDLALNSGVARRIPVLSRKAVRTSGVILSTAALFTVAAGPNVQSALAEVNEAYRAAPDVLLLSGDERLLLERLPETVPPDSLILASPRTGASLAYAFAGVQVTEPHVFGMPTEDEQFLAAHLAEIADNPEVCAAIRRVGADYALDFGDRDVWDDAAAAERYRGIQNLTQNDYLRLVDSEGDRARLFEIRGCQ